MSSPIFINSPAALAEAIATWDAAPWLTVDTEFLRIDSYHPKLCLVQVGDGQHGWVVDTLAIADLQPLFTSLLNPIRCKVFHAAGQDLEIFAHLAGACPTPLFDTQLAAALLGLGDQLGYAALVQQRLGIALDKSLSRTDWSRRPLTQPELDYAAADVTCLAQMYPALREQLESKGRLAWLQEDAARVSTADYYRPQPTLAWQRLKGLARLPPAAQVIAAEITEWREHEAVDRNRPRGWIVEDEAVYRIAEAAPISAEALARLQVLPPKTLAKHSEALLAAVAKGRGRPPQTLANDERLNGPQKALLAVLREVIQTAATQHGLPPGLIAPRAELDALVWQGASASVRVLTGWRETLVGDALRKALG